MKRLFAIFAALLALTTPAAAGPLNPKQRDESGSFPKVAFFMGTMNSVTLVETGNASDADTLTLTNGSVSKVFEVDNNSTYTAGNVQVSVGALTATAVSTAFVTAINGQFNNLGLIAYKQTLGSNFGVVVADVNPDATTAFTAAESVGNAVLTETTSTGGRASGPLYVASVSKAASANESTHGIDFVFPFTVSDALCVHKNSSNVAKSMDTDATITINSMPKGSVLFVQPGGATDTISAADVITCTAWGY